jgi:choline dehydrogenase-like flavoprotein
MAADQDVLGNTGLASFDVCIVGSGAGGGTAAHVLAAGGKNVLVLESGHNPWPGLGESDTPPLPLHSNDELKYAVREWIDQGRLTQPRTWRKTAAATAAIHPDVNLLPRVLGGAWSHADMKTPRYNKVDFAMKSTIEALISGTPGLAVPGFGSDSASANWADWPLSYDDLAPFYYEAECLYGVQGDPNDNPFASSRDGNPFPMPPGLPMYFNLLLADGATATTFFGDTLHPHRFPTAINSRFYGNRPPCVDCGSCADFGCPNNAKGSPPVTTLLWALRSGRCQVRYNCNVVRLVNDGGHVSAVEYVDGDGVLQTANADAFVLAASPIESARLCFLSPTPGGSALGNSSGQVGQNLMFHLQTNVNGFVPQRIHGQRGRAVTHGISDFRGVEPGGEAVRVFDVGGTPTVALGGICELSASQGKPITEDGDTYTRGLPGAFGRRFGIGLKNAMRDQALGQHLIGLLMQAEDAPQRTNAVDLDPSVVDVFGRAVPRVTYSNHAFEKQARLFYVPYMKQVVEAAGAQQAFVPPCEGIVGDPPTSRHVLGTLRMGSDSATSVTRPDGRFHDVDNLYACDGSVFVTSSGYNPTLTLIALSLKTAHTMAGTSPGPC